MGVIGAFGYELTSLMALIPPLIIVIGIPNCIYLINKYQQEFKNHGDKLSALDKIIQKVGNATFLTNATTALGFGTFVFTNSSIMIEFGLVSFINILCMFVISICLVPIIYSFLPPPNEKHTKHLDRKWVFSFVNALVIFSKNYRKQVYLTTIILLFFGAYGTISKGRTPLSSFSKNFKSFTICPFSGKSSVKFPVTCIKLTP